MVDDLVCDKCGEIFEYGGVEKVYRYYCDERGVKHKDYAGYICTECGHQSLDYTCNLIKYERNNIRARKLDSVEEKLDKIDDTIKLRDYLEFFWILEEDEIIEQDKVLGVELVNLERFELKVIITMIQKRIRQINFNNISLKGDA